MNQKPQWPHIDQETAGELLDQVVFARRYDENPQEDCLELTRKLFQIVDAAIGRAVDRAWARFTKTAVEEHREALARQEAAHLAATIRLVHETMDQERERASRLFRTSSPQ